ncbi:unnamed protein product [Urochloa humidicola]
MGLPTGPADPRQPKGCPRPSGERPTCATVPRARPHLQALLGWHLTLAGSSRLPAATGRASEAAPAGRPGAGLLVCHCLLPALPAPRSCQPLRSRARAIYYAALHGAPDPSPAARAPSGSAAANFLCPEAGHPKASVSVGSSITRSEGAGAEHEPGSPIRN